MTPDPMEQVMVRMPADMHAAIKRLAIENDRSMAAEIRRVIREHLARMDRPGGPR